MPIEHDLLVEIIEKVGYIGLFLIVFSESGLLIGILFPGDSLLFTAGFLASTGLFNLPLLVIIVVAAAISGDAVGYAFGRRIGRRLFDRPDSRWFRQRHLRTAEAFYERHGGKAIVLARFLPIVRTLAPICAGIANMQYRKFAIYNAVGGVLWGAGMTTGGYLLGEVIPDPDRYLLPVIVAIVLISLLPSLIHLYVDRRKHRVLHAEERLNARATSVE